jgi:MtN3 and saliva related transmembrane protein
MASFIPQVVKIVRERDASGVSLRMYLVTMLGFALWTTYGLLIRQWPLIGSNLVSLSLAALIFSLKVASERRPRRREGETRAAEHPS